jgi:hypothetical protein
MLDGEPPVYLPSTLMSQSVGTQFMVTVARSSDLASVAGATLAAAFESPVPDCPGSLLLGGCSGERSNSCRIALTTFAAGPSRNPPIKLCCFAGNVPNTLPPDTEIIALSGEPTSCGR